MASYLKDKRIELWRCDSKEIDEDGFPIVKNEKIASLWAYYRHVSSKETYAAMSVQYQVNATFIINYRKDINPLTDYIVFRGKQYDINSVDDYEGGKRDLKISAKYRE